MCGDPLKYLTTTLLVTFLTLVTKARVLFRAARMYKYTRPIYAFYTCFSPKPLPSSTVTLPTYDDVEAIAVQPTVRWFKATDSNPYIIEP